MGPPKVIDLMAHCTMSGHLFNGTTFLCLCYTSCGALVGKSNSSMGPPKVDISTIDLHFFVFVIPVVEHWLERVIAQWVHQKWTSLQLTYNSLSLLYQLWNTG